MGPQKRCLSWLTEWLIHASIIACRAFFLVCGVPCHQTHHLDLSLCSFFQEFNAFIKRTSMHVEDKNWTDRGRRYSKQLHAGAGEAGQSKPHVPRQQPNSLRSCPFRFFMIKGGRINRNNVLWSLHPPHDKTGGRAPEKYSSLHPRVTACPS